MSGIANGPFPIPISQLPPAGPLLGGEWVAMVQNGVTCRTTSAALIAQGIPGPPGAPGAPGAAGPPGPAGPSSFGDAPVDGQLYGRQNLAWSSITAAIAAVALNDNRVVNGDMRIDQRNAGASGTAFSYTVDRWKYSGTQASKGAWGRIAGSFPGFPYALSFTSSSAFTPASTDYFMLSQPVEADMVSDFQWGTANAQPVTLSFWVQSSLTGTFSGAIMAAGGGRSYPFSYAVVVPNVPVKVSITIPGDTAGTWVMSGNAEALSVCFDLGAGSSLRGPASAWASANYIGVTGAVNVVSTNGAYLYVTGVKLEIGSVATPFNRQSLAKSMADCQRYYQTISASGRTYAAAINTITFSLSWFQMRAAPTATLVSAGARGNVTGVAFNAYQPNSGNVNWASTAIGDTYAVNDLWGLAAEL